MALSPVSRLVKLSFLERKRKESDTLKRGLLLGYRETRHKGNPHESSRMTPAKKVALAIISIDVPSGLCGLLRSFYSVGFLE